MTGSARDAYRRGMEAASRGDADGARRAFQEALGADSNAYRAAYNLGVISDRSGETDQALSFYRQALRIQPDYERALEGVVRIYIRQGRAGDAVAFAEPVAQRWVRNLAVQAVYGDALVAANRPADAVTAARAALRRDERFVPAMIVLAKANLRLGRNELAQSILEQAMSIDGANSEGHFLRGQMYEAERQLQPAIQEYRRAIEINGDYADARMRLGILMLGGANYDEAVQQFEAVARLVPDLTQVHLNLGDAYRSTKQWTKAKAEFDRVIARSPTTVEVHYNIGLMYWAQAADLTGQEQLDMLQRAQQELTQYRTGMGSRLPRDDQSSTFIDDLNRQIDRTRRAIERDAARRQREAERAARQQATSGGDSTSTGGGE
jgi:tetratricopeptide (TPR) repeat protein